MPRVPSPAQMAAMFRPIHALIDATGEPITLRVRNAAGGFDDIATTPEGEPLRAKVAPFRADEIIPGGPAKLGDFKLIVRMGALPPGLRRLENKDRVAMRGRDYAVMNWDDTGHAVGGETMAIEIWARG